MSDDLLLLEETCFTAIGKVFDHHVDDAGAAFATAWRRAKDDPKAVARDHRLTARLTALHEQALTDARPAVEQMAADALQVIIDSIGDELALCEATVAKKYAGIADTAMLATRTVAHTLVEPRLAAYDTAAATARLVFAEALRRQTQFGAMYAEDQTRVAMRLFNPQPNSLRGSKGRGAWWKAPSTLNAAARDVSIRLAGQVRRMAMMEFNAAAALR